MFGDQSHRIASGVANAHGAARATTDNVGHALLVVLVALLSLIALLFVLARLEPRKDARGSPMAAGRHLHQNLAAEGTAPALLQRKNPPSGVSEQSVGAASTGFEPEARYSGQQSSRRSPAPAPQHAYPGMHAPRRSGGCGGERLTSWTSRMAPRQQRRHPG